MEDMKNKQVNAPEEKDDRFGWIGEGIPQLQEGSIDFVLKPTVKVPQERYDELVRAEATLDILCRVLIANSPYDMKIYRAIVGESRLPLPKDDGDEK